MHLPSGLNPSSLYVDSATPAEPGGSPLKPSPSILGMNLHALAAELHILQQEVVQLRQQNAELIHLRQEVAHLRQENQDLHLTLEAITEHGDTIEKELRSVNQQLQMVAEVDGLTQLANRHKFDQYLALQWRTLGHLGHPLGLILCDIDYFKQFNNFYGHIEGDACLQQVAQVLKHNIKRSDDLVARYGGEEFVIVLPNTGLPQTKVVADRLRQAVADLHVPHRKSQICDHVTLSLGIASWVPNVTTSPQQLITQADQCLYRAKAQGRNQVISAESVCAG